ncbi:MAG: CPA2 family monovalent cation:H+ antiporter-2 [Hyphomicrobiaceae bacterium]
MFLVDAVALLAVSVGALLVGRMIGVPPMVAWLLGGVVVGPGVLGLFGPSVAIDQLAEAGVALLLFGVGIEFSLDQLRKTLARTLAGGSMQVGATIVLTTLAAAWAGLPVPHAILVGFLVSLSSTAMVFKLLADHDELDAPQGQGISGILLFQDLAIVPMMLLIPVLAQSSGEGSFVAATVFALGRAALAIAALVVIARVVLPRLLDVVANSGVPELFSSSALLVAFGMAVGAHELGLSLPLGAFLAGVALSDTLYSHQVFADLLPLRDAFVALFFTSVGLLLDPVAALADPLLLLSMLGAVAVKGVICAMVVGVLWRSWRLALFAGVALAQVGEFSFVLVREGVSAGLVTHELEQAFLGAAVLSMALTPYALSGVRRLVGASNSQSGPESSLTDHVLLAGYGATGAAVARVLGATSIPLHVIEMDPVRVRAARKDGVNMIFGDASRRALLGAAGIAHCRAFVVAVSDRTATRRIVSLARQINPTAPILVRAHAVTEVAELEHCGATEVIPAELEASIELFARLLERLGVPRHIVRVQEGIIRLGHYHALRGAITPPEMMDEIESLMRGGTIETVQIMHGSAAAGRTLAELRLRETTGAAVLTLVRDDVPQANPTGETQLIEGDLVVLFGPHEALAQAVALCEPAMASAPTGVEAVDPARSV